MRPLALWKGLSHCPRASPQYYRSLSFMLWAELSLTLNRISHGVQFLCRNMMFIKAIFIRIAGNCRASLKDEETSD